MRSRAHFKSHPLHPILVGFPIAFFTATPIFDILALSLDNPSFLTTAYYLLMAGILTGLAAAVPGLIDYLYTVPPASSAKKRASRHAILNVCMIALFAVAWVHRTTSDDPSPTTYITLELVGLIIMMVAGWMGGTLVHRNQIGVDPRYAFAGKWREERVNERDGRVSLEDPELKRDQMMLLHVGPRRIVIAMTETGYVAFDDRCPHRGGSLAGGMMICGTVQCPWHGSQFDVTTGGVKAGPAKQGIMTHRVDLVGNNLQLVFTA
jgi:uncharacterized membrane protein/nitrite reductase/ring-hydroxylating ferredoxin subunit